MPEPIRVLHFADLHVGMENYGRIDPQTGISSRIRDFLDRLDEVIAHAFEHQADLVIFAGDAFKTRDPDPTQQREFARRIKSLADKIPVFMLVGNHDVPGMAARATSVDIFRALEVPNIIVGRTIDSQVVQTRSGPVFLAWVPFPVRSRLLAQDQHKGASVEALDKAVEGLIIDEIDDLRARAAEQVMPRVLVGHFSVAGATYGSERSVMLGRDLVIPKSALSDPVWDYTALGHIHKHQDLTALPAPQTSPDEAAAHSPAIVYAGSLERIDFGEEAEDKGFCWVRLERGRTRWEFVKVNARAFVTIRVDGREEADPTSAVLARIRERESSAGPGRSLKGAIVRVSVRLREAQAASLYDREIEKALREAEVGSIAAIGKEIDREVRSLLGDASPETLTPSQLIERYFISKGKPPEETARYVRAAETLFDD